MVKYSLLFTTLMACSTMQTTTKGPCNKNNTFTNTIESKTFNQTADAAAILHDPLKIPYCSTLAPKDKPCHELTQYKAWESLYLRTMEAIDEQGTRGDIAMRYFLMMAYVGYVHKQAMASESFSSSLLPVFKKQGDRVVAILLELPFLVEVTCYYLGKYFGFEDQHTDPQEKEQFWEHDAKAFHTQLDPKSAKKCVDAFRRAKN